MVDILEGPKLYPRDAIHIASMKTRGIDPIISQDTDFDGIHGIERIDPADMFK